MLPTSSPSSSKTSASGESDPRGSESSGSEADSSGLDTDSDRRNVYMAAAADCAQKPGDPIVQNERFDQERHNDRGKLQQCVRTVDRRDMTIANVGSD